MSREKNDDTVWCQGGCGRALHSVTSRYTGYGPTCLKKVLAQPPRRPETHGQMELFTPRAGYPA